MAAFGAFLLAAGAAHGWGHEAHRLIAQKACEAMPEPVRAFFIENQDKIVQHAIDPYLWRESDDPKHQNEHANHYFDIDYEGFGPYPFNELPRDYEAAVEKFGEETFDKYGRLPWRIVSYLDVVTEAFRSEDSERIAGARSACVLRRQALPALPLRHELQRQKNGAAARGRAVGMEPSAAVRGATESGGGAQD